MFVELEALIFMRIMILDQEIMPLDVVPNNKMFFKDVKP